jgi:hypothetical protein
MMNETPRNPYDPQRPTTDPAMFFGRDDVFAFIRQNLITGRRAQAMAIIGQRGMGKTSVLMQIVHHVEARYLIAYIDLADVRFDEVGGLFAAMADAARQALETAGLSTYRLPPLPTDPEVDFLKWFSETYLDVTLSAVRGGRRLVFLFDETSRLLDAIDRRDVSEDFHTTLSELLARDDRMDIIFAVDAEDEHRLETFSPLSDPLLHRRLGPLDDTAAKALTRQPSAPFYELEGEATEGVLTMTGGQPYLLHVVNGLLWERAQSRRQREKVIGKGTVTLDDVHAVLRQATDEADPVLRMSWVRSTHNERRALSALTALTNANYGLPVRIEDARLWLLRESDELLDETALAAALRRLEYREVLRSSEAGTYTFTSGLQHQWLVLNGDAQPVSAVSTSARPPVRRMVIPVTLLLSVAVLLALILGRLVATPVSGAQSSPTVTLALDIIATRRAAEATQTFQAMPTFTPSRTPTPTITPTSTPSSSPTPSNTPTFTSSPTASNTPTISGTPRPSNTPTRTLSPTPSRTPTYTATRTSTITPPPSSTSTPTITPSPPLTITPPPFPTAQLRATSTLRP